jgi:hypothetical protein
MGQNTHRKNCHSWEKLEHSVTSYSYFSSEAVVWLLPSKWWLLHIYAVPHTHTHTIHSHLHLLWCKLTFLSNLVAIFIITKMQYFLFNVLLHFLLNNLASFDVLMAVTMKTTICQDVTPCSLALLQIAGKPLPHYTMLHPMFINYSFCKFF